MSRSSAQMLCPVLESSHARSKVQGWRLNDSFWGLGWAVSGVLADGWTIVAIVGRWGLGELTLILGRQLAVHDDPQLARIGELLLREGLPDQVRLTLVNQRLRENARRLGRDPERLGGDLEASLSDALRLGAEDVLPDQLVELVGARPEDLAALHQGAAFALAGVR